MANASDKINEVAKAITAEIIAELERGNVPWKKTWDNICFGSAFNYASKRPYEGFNQFYLSYKSAKIGWPTSRFLSFAQAKKLGGHVRKGEKSTVIIFWKTGLVKSKRNDDQGNPIFKKTFTPFYHYVFNVSQIDGIEFEAIEEPVLRPNSIIDSCASIVASMQNAPIINNGGNRAFYARATDSVTMPLIGQFTTSSEYYNTLFHELVHSTGHESRLDRFKQDENTVVSFGSESYSKEELTAEMGAAFLSSHAGISSSSLLGNSAAYIKGWASALKNDPKLIITAANKAGNAAKYILNISEGAPAAMLAETEETEA